MKLNNLWAGVFCVLSVVLLLSGCGGKKERIIEFSADLVETYAGVSMEHKIYVKGSWYLMEQTEEGQKLLVIVDQDAGKTRVVVPSQKQYVELNTTDPISLMNDPFQSYKYVSVNFEKRGEGTETVSGYNCEKTVYSQQGTDVVTAWYTEEFSLPLKIILHSDQEHIMEIQNIRTDSVSDDLFKVPEGFTKLIAPGEQPLEIPEWALQYNSLPVIGVPVENKAMKSGEAFRVKVIPEMAFKVTGTNLGQKRAAFTAVPFKDGAPTRDPATCSIGFAEFGMGGGFTFKETPYEADDIVVHVDEGDINIAVTTFKVGPGEVIEAGKSFTVTLVPGKNIEMRFLNLNEGESKLVYKFNRHGVEVEPSVAGPQDVRTIFLTRLYESRERNLTIDSDEIIIEVASGKVSVNVRQP